MASTFNARDAAVYERSMGRWSRRLAPGFAGFAGIERAARVLDVGCGTGSLLFELADNTAHRHLTGIDASEIYLAAAQAQANAQSAGSRITFQHGDACAMPFAEDSFDAALCQLVLQFVPQPGEAVAEMRRVVRPGGIVAAAVWNSGGGMPHQRMFWDTAAMLDPAADTLRGQTFSRPMTKPDDLYGLFERVRPARRRGVHRHHPDGFLELRRFLVADRGRRGNVGEIRARPRQGSDRSPGRALARRL